MSFLGGIAILALSVTEHVRSVRPSSLLNLYIVLSIPLDICQVRTLYLRHDNQAILTLLTTSIAIKVVVFLLENKHKQSILMSPYKGWTPWATSGIVGRTFFWWLNPLFWKGLRVILTLDDLYSSDQELLSVGLQQRMEKGWTKRNLLYDPTRDRKLTAI
jgi:ATP-binding cassette, subfamily C (CFTR/MRP), member 1